MNSRNQKQLRLGGRAVGTPNKVTAQVRDAFASLIESNLQQMASDLQSLKPKERLEVIVALARFVVPTIRSIELKTAEARPFPAFAIRIDGQIEQMEEEYQSIDHSLSDDDE
jgi:hypothetical protein